MGKKEEKLYDMIRNGKAAWSGGKPMGISNRIVSKGKSVSSAVILQREIASQVLFSCFEDQLQKASAVQGLTQNSPF
jgi:hypothetical protein